MKTTGFSSAWILLGVVVGLALGLFVPLSPGALDGAQWGLLAVMVFLVVASLPVLSLGRAIAKPRVVVALVALNLLVVPLIAFILSRVVWQIPALQVGLLLVLLAPGVALSLNTARQAGGNVESVLAATPLLLGGQLVVVPLYAVWLSDGVLSFADLPPTFPVIGAIILAPSVLALLVQLVATRNTSVARGSVALSRGTVPVIAVAVLVVVWNHVPSHAEQLTELLRLVPLFFAFLVLLAPLGLFAGILQGLSGAEKRALMIVGAGRGGIIMLPITLALDPAVWGLVPLVVVIQLSLEVLGMMVYRSIVPEIVPTHFR